MGQRLLIVDSDRNFLKECQVGLEAAFEIDQLSSPEGVTAKVEAGGYAAVLISVEISDNKGYALCSGLRRIPALADLKIILISSKATEEEYRRHQSLKGRADAYLHKPISAAALVEALKPFVPPRSVDPDNPFEGFSDGEFGGGDWLSELRTDIEADAAMEEHSTSTQPLPHQAPSSAPNQTIALPAGVINAMANEAENVAQKARLQELQAQLAQREARVIQLEQDFQILQRQHDSVTQNLDDLARRQADAEDLQRKLSEAEQALKRFEEGSESGDSLRAQLREGMKERHDLLQQIDSTNTLLAEKTQKVIDLMKDRDRHQQKAMDDEVKLERLEALEGAHAQLLTKAAEADRALEEARGEAAKVPGLEEALSESRNSEAETRGALGRVEAVLAEASERIGALSAEKARLEDRVRETSEELGGLQARFQAKADEVAGLETTVRSLGRDMVDLEQLVAAKDRELNAQRQQLDQQKEALQAKEEALSAAQAERSATQHKLDELGATLTTELARMESERADLVGRMNGELAAKDAELETQNKELFGLRDTLTRHEASLDAAAETKSRLEAHLAQTQDRLKAAASLFAELEATLRKAQEL